MLIYSVYILAFYFSLKQYFSKKTSHDISLLVINQLHELTCFEIYLESLSDLSHDSFSLYSLYPFSIDIFSCDTFSCCFVFCIEFTEPENPELNLIFNKLFANL